MRGGQMFHWRAYYTVACLLLVVLTGCGFGSGASNKHRGGDTPSIGRWRYDLKPL